MLQPLLRPVAVAANDRLYGAPPLMLPAPPALDFDFVGRPSLQYPGLPPIAFTRASVAARVNASGLVETVAADVPRFDHHPMTGARRGLLIEGARTNICLESETLATSPWTPENVTVNVNQAVAPDGATTADKLEETVDNSFHRIAAGFSMTVTNVAHTVSFWTKADERSSGFVDVYHGDGSGFAGSFVFDLATGTAGSLTGIVASAEIEEWPNGWYRVWCVFTPNAGSDGRFDLGICNPADNTRGTYVGTVGSGLFYWGAQFEAGTFPTSYIKTTGTAATRAMDKPDLETISPWFSANEGTLLGEATILGLADVAIGNRPIAEFNDGTNANRMAVIITPSADGNASRGLVRSSDAVSADMNDGTSWTVGRSRRIVLAYKVNDFVVSAGGATPQADMSGMVATGQTRLSIGGNFQHTGPLFGHVRRVAYWPKRLLNFILQTLSVNP